jgi:hypothetical protein
MNDLREKLADVIRDDASGWTPEDITDAIIAALPDMVVLLVWDEHSHTVMSSGAYEIKEHHLNAFTVYFWGKVIHECSGGAARHFAKAAAQAHYVAISLAALGIDTTTPTR